MTVAFSDDNRVTWFVCLGPSSNFCDEFVERDLVTFQRAGRRDVVLARGVGSDAVPDPEGARRVFGNCNERLWAKVGFREMYRFETGDFVGEGQAGYRVTSPAMVHMVILSTTKPVGLLTDEELESLVEAAFGDPRKGIE